MKHVGKAVRDYRMDNNSQQVVLIGIVPWGKINNRKALLNSKVIHNTRTMTLLSREQLLDKVNHLATQCRKLKTNLET